MCSKRISHLINLRRSFLLTLGTPVTILTNPKMTASAMTVASAQADLTMLGTNQASGAVAVLTNEPSCLEEIF